jgi:hypothetical protein
MKTIIESRKRNILLALPLLFLPFTTLFFWALGGGHTDGAQAAVPVDHFNSKLPGALLKKDSTEDKLSYYLRAAKDSLKFSQDKKVDPNYHADTTRALLPERYAFNTAVNTPQSSATDLAANEQKIRQRLAALDAQAKQPAVIPDHSSPVQQAVQHHTAAAKPDPDLQQMNGLLEKILDIQHPERLKNNPGSASKEVEKAFEAIPAVIDGKQKVIQGGVVRLRLTDSIRLNANLIPKGQLVYGNCSIYNQRLTLTIKNIRIGHDIIPVDLTVFDMNDGLEGINVPEAVTTDVVKEGSDNAVQGLQLMTMDQGVGTQLAGAGLNAAKGLFGKKVKPLRAKLKDGHPLLLRDNKRINSINK